MLSVSCRLLEREPDRINAILLATLRAGKRIPHRIQYTVYLFLDNYSPFTLTTTAKREIQRSQIVRQLLEIASRPLVSGNTKSSLIGGVDSAKCT